MKNTSAVDAKIAELVKKAKAKREKQELELLEKPAYQNLVLNSKDTEVLDAIIENISTAYDAPIFTGFTFCENTEKLVAIISKLQFAKREQRELINKDYYLLLNRSLRDMVLEAYGRLPYYKEADTIQLADGTTKVLDPNSVERAMAGTPTDVEKLLLSLQIVSNKLGLVGDLTVTQTQADKAWEIAKNKANTARELAEVTEQLASA